MTGAHLTGYRWSSSGLTEHPTARILSTGRVCIDSGRVIQSTDIDSQTDTLIRRLDDDGVPLEIVGDLRWHDIDWASSALRERKPCGHRCLLGLTLGLTDRSPFRHHHLSSATMFALASLREREFLRRVREGASWYPSDPVLTTRDGRRLHGADLPLLDEALADHGVPHPHSPYRVLPLPEGAT